MCLVGPKRQCFACRDHLLSYVFSLSNWPLRQVPRPQAQHHQATVSFVFSLPSDYSQSESSLAVIVGNPLKDRSALISVKFAHSAGTALSANTASTGHSVTHA